MIHGGAVARKEAGIALAGASGSGKTTLIAHLIRRGYRYLADDLVALSAPDGRIVAWPLPLSVKEGSWSVIARCYPGFQSFPEYPTTRGLLRQIVPRPEVWDADPVALKSLVFPNYVAGADAELTPLALIEAVQRLLSDRIWFGYPITEARVRTFLEWLENKPIYGLVYGDAFEAGRLIEDIA
jgi:hypothetical protein